MRHERQQLAYSNSHVDDRPLVRERTAGLVGVQPDITLVAGLVRRAAQKAGLFNNGPHMLRHKFCSHLAMRGAPARAIQQLAGHSNLTTTQRYMHLSPAALDSAIRLIDRPECKKFRGDMVETEDRENAKSNV